VHLEEAGVLDEVADVELDQRVEDFPGRGRAAGHLPDPLEQIASPLLEDGLKELRFAGIDGVDRAHRQARQLRDVLHLGGLEAPLGEDLLGGLEDVLPVDLVAGLPGLLPRLPSHGAPISFENAIDNS
jgi:hypothetical protein